jgi:hypothetical protein
VNGGADVSKIFSAQYLVPSAQSSVPSAQYWMPEGHHWTIFSRSGAEKQRFVREADE